MDSMDYGQGHELKRQPWRPETILVSLGLREFQPHFSDRLATRGQGGCVETESLGR